MEAIQINKASIEALICCIFLFGIGYISGTFYMGERLVKEMKATFLEESAMREYLNLKQQNKGE